MEKQPRVGEGDALIFVEIRDRVETPDPPRFGKE
jgi:hypothetical protein